MPTFRPVSPFEPPWRRRRVTFSAQYNWIVGGDAESKFSDLDPEVPDVKVDLNGGHGFELSAIAEIPLGRDSIRVGRSSAAGA
jgi:hypothetical protein